MTLEFDHYLLVNGNRAETRRLISLIRKLHKRKEMRLETAEVLHEDDGACCAKESWDSTVERITIKGWREKK